MSILQMQNTSQTSNSNNSCTPRFLFSGARMSYQASKKNKTLLNFRLKCVASRITEIEIAIILITALQKKIIHYCDGVTFVMHYCSHWVAY